MGTSPFTVHLTESALADLQGMDDYWAANDEPDRGEQYVRDLFHAAQSSLSDPDFARRGRLVRTALLPGTQEMLVYQGSYRIIYRVDESEGSVYVLRFWHSHRDEPHDLN